MGEAQGKKVSPPPLRHGRSRRCRPLARSSHQRPRGSADLTALRRRRGGYRVTRTRGHAPPAKEKKPWRTDGRYATSELGSTAPIAKIVSHALKDPPSNRSRPVVID
jgi:hypothetical protein